MTDPLSTAAKRTAEMAAVFMIGNGLVGLLTPRRQVSLWRSQVKPVDQLVRRYDGDPAGRRWQGVRQLAGGLAIIAVLSKAI